METERWLDKVAHAMIKYNKSDQSLVEKDYDDKEHSVRKVSVLIFAHREHPARLYSRDFLSTNTMYVLRGRHFGLQV